VTVALDSASGTNSADNGVNLGTHQRHRPDQRRRHSQPGVNGGQRHQRQRERDVQGRDFARACRGLSFSYPGAENGQAAAVNQKPIQQRNRKATKTSFPLFASV
jgi:hypothetical protein